MAATSIFTVADNSALTLHKHLTGQTVPSAFASSTYGCRVYLKETSILQSMFDDGWTDGAYVGYTHSRRPGKGKMFRFSYVTGGVTYTLEIPACDIRAIENINVSEN